MGTLLTINEAARRLMTWDGKSVSPATVRFWILAKGLFTQRDGPGEFAKHLIDEDDLRDFIAGYSSYTFRDSEVAPLAVREMLELTADLFRRLEELEEEHQAVIKEEAALTEDLYGRGATDIPLPSKPASPGREKSPSIGRKARRATLSPEYRSYWVGRGEVAPNFAFFLYLHEAHGINHNTANSHRRFARKAQKGEALSLYPCTVMESGVFGGEERVVVTREQAIININVIHNHACQDFGTNLPPPEFLCLDKHCPRCVALWPSYQEEEGTE